MNVESMNNISKTNWEAFDALTDAEIDTSDIPLITEEMCQKSRWWKPATSLNVLVEVDRDTLAWFQTQGEASDQHMAAALKIYADAQKTTVTMRQSA
jgi:uncharacterized protein (DUF4415 family)